MRPVMLGLVGIFLAAGVILTFHPEGGVFPPEKTPARTFLETARRGDVDALKDLLPKGVSAEELEQSLREAVESGKARVVEAVLPYVKDAPAKNRALVQAVQKEQPKIVAALLKHGADPNTMADRSSRAIQVAVRRGYAEIVRQLRRAGASE